MLCLVSVRYRLGAGLFIKVAIMVPTAFHKVVKATMYVRDKEGIWTRVY
jgi:hypothetical protein